MAWYSPSAHTFGVLPSAPLRITSTSSREVGVPLTVEPKPLSWSQGDGDPWQFGGIKGRRQYDFKILRFTPWSVLLTETRCQTLTSVCWSRVIYFSLSSIKIRSFEPLKKVPQNIFKVKSRFWKEKHLHIYWKQGLLKERTTNDFKILTSTLRLFESRNRIYWYWFF